MPSQLVNAVKMASGSYPLPGILQQIAESAGLPAALALAREFGGRDVFCPMKRPLPTDNPLVRALGAPAADAVADIVIKGRVLIPFGPFSLCAMRFASFVGRIESGTGIHQAAREECLHSRTATRWASLMHSGRISHADLAAYRAALDRGSGAARPAALAQPSP